ncbi:MAG: hypothetical protein JO283_00765 [Bradyrhizobium sp.]|nr:hypothetical protein [Bradyrhizobium sp.]
MFVIAIALSVQSAFAKYHLTDLLKLREKCKIEVGSLFKGVRPGGQRIISRLKANLTELTPARLSCSLGSSSRLLITTRTMLNTYLQAKQQQSAALAMYYTVFTPRCLLLVVQSRPVPKIGSSAQACATVAVDFWRAMTAYSLY